MLHGTRLLALVFSISVHVVAVLVLWAAPSKRAPTRAPVEIELTFKQPEARRVPPPPVPAPVVASPPRRAKGSGRGGAKNPAPAHAAPLPLVAMAGGDFDAFPPSGGGEDAGIGDDGEDEVTQTQPLPPPIRTEAVLVSLPRIAYPERARLAEVEGVVVLWVTVTADGRVVGVDVRSSPDGSLSDAARSAMLRAAFRPATVRSQTSPGEQPVAAQFEYRYRFELE